MLPCLVFAPLPLRSWFRRSCGAAAAAAAVASGSRAAAVPSFAAARGGGGFPAWVRSRLPVAAVLGAGYAPSSLGLLACAPCSPAWSWAQAALRLCAGYAPSSLGLSLSRSCALLGLGRKPPRASVLRPNPARCRVQPLSRTHAAPLPNCTKTHQNYTKKRQKARFLCGISPQASRRASTDSTLKSPVSGAFWAAVDAAQKPKRYPKPSTWWGAAPCRAGGKAQLPRSQSCCRV